MRFRFGSRLRVGKVLATRIKGSCLNIINAQQTYQGNQCGDVYLQLTWLVTLYPRLSAGIRARCGWLQDQGSSIEVNNQSVWGNSRTTKQRIQNWGCFSNSLEMKLDPYLNQRSPAIFSAVSLQRPNFVKESESFFKIVLSSPPFTRASP
ncbi:hypothetical protein VNO77_02216 [Canavalia gladiata]|uniref:Uncharacterized protein n=1 Tax=Canavalia gladiata TaxID=3824 RepID=A0AAN9MZ08_CANGL